MTALSRLTTVERVCLEAQLVEVKPLSGWRRYEYGRRVSVVVAGTTDPRGMAKISCGALCDHADPSPRAKPDFRPNRSKR